MSTLTSTAVFYHMSAPEGSEATEWIQGQARKGTAGGQQALGLIMFARDAIDQDINGGVLRGARLTLSRDAAYGTGNADLTIAPVNVESVSGAMAYEQCLEMAIRPLHHMCAVEGETANIDLPGAWLRALQEGLINGIMLYNEEGTDTYLQFGGTAYLALDSTTAYVAPVWCRPVGEGDIISDSIRSHVWDLKEIEHYLNIRRARSSLEAIDLGLGDAIDDSCLYSAWYGLIGTLRTAADEVITAEQGTAISWCVLDPDELPKADAINELRNWLEVVTGTAERLSVTTYGRVSFEHVGSDFTVNRKTAVAWAAKKAPMSGMNWGYEIRNNVKVKVYNRRFGIWIFRNQMLNKVITSAKLRVTRSSGRGGSWPVVLYPVLVGSVPTSSAKKSVNQVMGTTACGRANCAVGQTVDIALSQDIISRIQAGTAYGVGVDDHEDWTNFGSSAVLILNE